MGNENKDPQLTPSPTDDDITTQLAAIEAESEPTSATKSTPDSLDDQPNRVPSPPSQSTDEMHEKLESALTPASGPKKRNYKKWALIGGGIVILLLVIAWFVPASRYFMLNTLGARGSLHVSGMQASNQDQSQQVTIKNITVEVDGQTHTSGDSSDITIANQKYGQHDVVVKKNGYAPYTQQVTLGFNPLFGLFGGAKKAAVQARLQAQGIPVTFTVKDWTSQLGLSVGDFSLGDITAKPAIDGKVTLTVPPSMGETVKVKATFAQDYLNKELDVAVNATDQEFTFVPSARHYFVSKRSGVFSIYSSYIDGSDIKEVVKGTNQETASLQFAVSPDGKSGVMASTRDGRRDENGNVLQKLYWIDLATGRFEEQEKGQSVILHDWSGNIITYSFMYIENGQYITKLRSLDTTTRNQYDLSGPASYFGRVHVAGSSVIFTKHTQENPEKGQTVNIVGVKGEGGRELASNTEDFRQLFFDRFAYQAQDRRWHEVTTGTGQVKSIDTPSQEGTLYIATESSKKERVFINFVDGRRILMLQGATEKELATQAGMTGPIRFLNSTTVVYRVVTPTETADYAVSTLGGKPQKVTDVTASSYSTPVFFSYY